MGAVGHISSVVVLLETAVGVGSGMEELPIGKGGIVELNRILGVADGAMLVLRPLP